MRTLQQMSGSGAPAHGIHTPFRRARVGARAWVLAVVMLALADAAAAAEAAPAADPSAPDEALRRGQRMLLERAKSRYEAGRAAGSDEAARPQLEGALDALHLAYGLSPAPWLLFNMAQVQSRLGACNEAADLYQRFLASDPAPAARSSAREALELLGACEDGLAPAPDDSLAPGLMSASNLDSIFSADRAEPPPSPARTPSPAAAAPAATSIAVILPWAFGGLAVMSGVAGAIYWNEAKAAKRDLDGLSVAGPEVTRTQQRGESALDLARVFGGISVGFALAAAGSYWWLEREKKMETPLEAALRRLSVGPLEGGAAAVYQSEF
jgi:tetratricopeptide (TPR) repeat protein